MAPRARHSTAPIQPDYRRPRVSERPALRGESLRALGAEHRTAEPGIAVVSAPGRARMRAPWFGEYSEYCDRVAPR
ncbi:hypothetical protein [Actinomycetospora cinnamomea]|uniref:hypothetical protein n=1 Tax=Actinomycetospora cinnamomea TaxID=663609 RepID=UPI001403C6CD|nr:hypothetical protein [Actinomycetospora cinnamomea]